MLLSNSLLKCQSGLHCFMVSRILFIYKNNTKNNTFFFRKPAKKRQETKTKTSPPLQSCHRSVHYISQPIHSSREPCLHYSLYKENCRYCLVLYLPAKTQLALSIRATSIYCLSAQTNYPQYRGGGKIQEKNLNHLKYLMFQFVNSLC